MNQPTILNLDDIKQIYGGIPSLSDFKYSLHWFGRNVIRVSSPQDYEKIAEYCNIIQFERRQKGFNIRTERPDFLKIEL